MIVLLMLLCLATPAWATDPSLFHLIDVETDVSGTSLYIDLYPPNTSANYIGFGIPDTGVDDGLGPDVVNFDSNSPFWIVSYSRDVTLATGLPTVFPRLVVKNAGQIVIPDLKRQSGRMNAHVCVDADGQLYRGSPGC